MAKAEKGISNNALVVLILIAIFISVAGTWISLDKLMPITGYGTSATGTATATVNTTVNLVLYNTTVAFGSVESGEVNSTTDNNPGAFNLSNEGSTYINVTVSATNLWSSRTNPSAFYNVSCRNETFITCEHSKIFNGSFNMQSVATTILSGLPYNATNHSERVDISIAVPFAEPSGAKSSTLTFTGLGAF